MPQSPNELLDWSNIISNFAVAAAAVYGLYGFWKWRRELIEKTKFKVARKMMLLALRFRDEYDRARNPWTDSWEWIERKKGDDEMENISKVLDERFARLRRLQPLQDTLRKFYEISWEAEVTLSEEDAKIVDLFEKLFQNLYIAIEFFFEKQLNYAKGHTEVLDNEKMTNKRGIIYGVKGDEISRQADSAADTVKKQLKKYIQ